MIKYILTAAICFFVSLVIYDVGVYWRSRLSPEKSFQNGQDHFRE